MFERRKNSIIFKEKCLLVVLSASPDAQILVPKNKGKIKVEK